MNRVGARLSVLLLCLLTSGCSKISAPLSPTTAFPQSSSLSGTVLATNGGERLEGVSLTTASGTVTSDASGGFTLPVTQISGSVPVTISGPSIVTRTMVLSAVAGNPLAPDVFLRDGTFDLAFYRAFARNGYEQPAQLQPLRRWQRAPAVYLKTVDEAGRPIDAVTLDTTEAALRDAVRLWTGDRFGLAGITRGTGTREGAAGWITVRWASVAASDRCGLSTVGTEGGWIELDYLGACGCGGPSRIYPRVVRHELGHALGYYHTDSPDDVMYGRQISPATCDLHPSAREQQYAKYVYSRPVGNTDPDHDPQVGVTDVRSLSSAIQP